MKICISLELLNISGNKPQIQVQTSISIHSVGSIVTCGQIFALTYKTGNANRVP
jgi:hypothetical protein